MDNIRDLLLAAEKGNANAQKDLAAMLASGSLGQIDNESAVYWYSKAAEQGLVDAKWNLGLMYVNGEGVEKSERFGLDLIEKSAIEGSWDACDFLSYCYKLGLYDFSKDPEKFEYWEKMSEKILNGEETFPSFGEKENTFPNGAIDTRHQ